MQSGKLLGYIISRWGIEVDPTKVKAIMDMPPPANISQLWTLQGRLQSIRWFIVQLADKIHPFQNLLRKGVPFVWTGKCQENFQQIKDYLLTPLVLMPPTDGRTLILYISATTLALGSLLAQNDNEGHEREVYYINCTLVGYELNYSTIEHPCLVVVLATQKLRHYMLNHQKILFAKIDPLKYLLCKATLTGWLDKWEMVLNEYCYPRIQHTQFKG